MSERIVGEVDISQYFNFVIVKPGEANEGHEINRAMVNDNIP